jgi:hypothetical protein
LFDDPIIAAPSSAGTWRDYWNAQDYRGKGFAEVAAEAATFEAEFTAVAQGLGEAAAAVASAQHQPLQGRSATRVDSPMTVQYTCISP